MLAGAAAAGVVMVSRRRSGRRAGRAERSAPPERTVAVTVLAPVGKAVAAWEDLDGGKTVVATAPAPGDRGTEVRVVVPDDGPRSGKLAWLRGETPEQQVRERLRRLAATVEAGEVVTTEGQPSGRGPVAEKLTRTVTGRIRAWGVR